MTNQITSPTRNLDRTSVVAVVVSLLAALTLYFVFYAPAIAHGVRSDVLPPKEIRWLEIHIVVYWVSYCLYFTGLLLAVIYFLGKATVRFPWIESITVVATVLAVVGLITGILFAKPAWNVWWVWDAKHTVVLLNTLFLLGISLLVLLTRRFSNSMYHYGALVILLSVAGLSCLWSFLIGFFFRVIHPQWFPYLFSR